ncbi:tyrosine-type recombinase/integrase [Duganella fentianensis]|uniref:tyrosine-type recombinase/integrase n=1 Tax=Duganella fentianensis TaxID=2692177 RepID=UPI0032B23334
MAKIRLTASRIAAFTCAPDKRQDFLWCEEAPGLAVRVTPIRKGRTEPTRTYIFQGKLKRDVIRIAIGDVATYSIKEAQRIANKFRAEIDNGQDPRVVRQDALLAEQAAREEREQAAEAEREAAAAQQRREQVTLAMAWSDYVLDKESGWSAHHRRAHRNVAQQAGLDRKRGKEKTTAGPLASLMPHSLASLDNDRVEAWAKEEAATRPASARLAVRLLKAFLNWCMESKAYAPLVSANSASSKKVTKAVGKPKVKKDVLQKEQLKVWFEAVRGVGNPVIAAYLQTLLLLGCRREELTHLRWVDVDFAWRSLRIGDKTQDERVVPLTPHVAALIHALPRRNEWVFSSLASESGRLAEPRYAHNKAVKDAGLPHLTLHGLRRSFATLSEWVEMPAGIAAQIQGHAPQGVREQNYIRRPLDLLRMWHIKIEEWVLEQAGLMPAAALAAAPELAAAA